MPALLISLLLIVSHQASARVFSYKDSSMGAMLRGTGGTSSLDRDAFGNSSGTDTAIGGRTRYAYSGELGFIFRLTEALNLRIGAEAIQHHPLKDEKGNSPAGVERFSMDSSVFVFNPNLTVEAVFSQTGNTRYFGEVGVGYAMVDVENRYRMTNTGIADLGVAGDFNEKMYGTDTSIHFGAGVETLFVDNVTFAVEAGYRILTVKTLKYRGEVGNIVSAPGSALEDSPVRNQDGTTRTLDLSGFFVGVAFRFYLNFL